jgi:hypothetical protein
MKGVAMPTWVWILIALAIVAVVALVAWSVIRNRRTDRLRTQFGPEYDRTVDQRGARTEAESELEARRKRREVLDIRPLDPAVRQRYVSSWQATQAHFVDDPNDAVGQADRLVLEVMRERGYPVEDFEQRAADVSVDHPYVVDNYRKAHQISLANDRGDAGTEDLRQAMVHYRSLFEELLETGGTDRMGEAR